MNSLQNFRLMASYNQWMNDQLYAGCARLSPDDLAADKGAFFGSVLGTLNHLVNADTIWLQRFAAHPANYAALAPAQAMARPEGLDHIQFTDLATLAAHRNMLDALIVQWMAEIAEADLDHVLSYVNMAGPQRKHFGSLLQHFFNHQTHHRGQITTLLSQCGVDLVVTDLLALIPNEQPA